MIPLEAADDCPDFFVPPLLCFGGGFDFPGRGNLVANFRSSLLIIWLFGIALPKRVEDEQGLDKGDEVGIYKDALHRDYSDWGEYTATGTCFSSQSYKVKRKVGWVRESTFFHYLLSPQPLLHTQVHKYQLKKCRVY